jgi:hypothetical protein
MARSKVAVVRVRPDAILSDIDRLHELAEVERALAPGATTILKDNISWHFPFPGANTTPWQLEGTIRALAARGFTDQVCVQNKTVVTNAFKGEDLNHYVPIFQKYRVPVLYNFEPRDITWSTYRPRAKMLVLDRIYPEGITIPDYFVGKNIVHLPTVKCVAGDTELVLADGSIATIESIVARAAERATRVIVDSDGASHVVDPSSGAAPVSVMAMDASGELRPFPVAIYSRSPVGSRRVLRLRTRTGRTLTASDDHRVWTLRGWVPLGELTVGDRVGVARRLRIERAAASQPAAQRVPATPRAGVARSVGQGMHVAVQPPPRATAPTGDATIADGDRLPAALFRAPDEEIEAFLGAYLDREGIVSDRQAEVLAVTPSGALARDLQNLFARIGVVAVVNEVKASLPGWPAPRSYHKVTIGGSSLRVLADRLPLRHATLRERLLAHAARVVAGGGLAASDDLAWDAVVEIAPAEGVERLYDLTVPGADSFVGNGIVVHNCHIYTTTTGAMKNAFGGLLNTKRHYTHSWIHKTLVDLLAIQREIHPGLFAVMDGTTAGDGPGPRTMRPVVKDVMLASADQVAIDAVAAKMMGFDPMSIEYIRLAHEAGLGTGRPEEIEIVGDPELASQSWGFSVGDNGASMIGDIMWFGPLKRFQKLFFHTPLVNVFVMGSELYHDYYRWPLRDRRVFERWSRDTAWGRLFGTYAATGPIGRDQEGASRAARG